MRLASLVEFLNTGQLGPLRPGMTLNQVAQDLGPPDWWDADASHGPAPHYWGYANHLEVFFTFDNGVHCPWFQIEGAGLLTGQAVRISDDLSLALDGLSGESTISAFIRSFVRVADVGVHLRDIANYPHPSVFAGNVEIIFNCGDEDFRDNLSLKEKILFCEKRAKIDSIYSYFTPDYAQGIPPNARAAETGCISGEEYLSLVGGEP